MSVSLYSLQNSSQTAKDIIGLNTPKINLETAGMATACVASVIFVLCVTIYEYMEYNSSLEENLITTLIAPPSLGLVIGFGKDSISKFYLRHRQFIEAPLSQDTINKIRQQDTINKIGQMDSDTFQMTALDTHVQIDANYTQFTDHYLKDRYRDAYGSYMDNDWEKLTLNYVKYLQIKKIDILRNSL